MIKSSFKKVEKPSSSQRCVFGHPDLDAVLHNSLSKGHLIIMEEDHPSSHFLALCRAFVSHHYHDGGASIVYETTPRWKHLICPLAKKEAKKEQGGGSEIAWRYDQMEMKLNKLVIDERINFVDLSKEVASPKQELLKIYSFLSTPKETYRSIEQAYIDSQGTGQTLKKLLLSSIPAFLYQDPEFGEFLKAVRCLTRSSHILTLITVPPIISEAVRGCLLKYADYYLQLGKVGKGYSDFTGSLRILKEVEVGTLRSVFRGPSLWGIKATRKALRIESLYEAMEGEPEGPKSDF